MEKECSLEVMFDCQSVLEVEQLAQGLEIFRHLQ